MKVTLHSDAKPAFHRLEMRWAAYSCGNVHSAVSLAYEKEEPEEGIEPFLESNSAP